MDFECALSFQRLQLAFFASHAGRVRHLGERQRKTTT